MLIAIDKRGSINLPAATRRQLGLEIGSYLDLQLAKILILARMTRISRIKTANLYFRNRASDF